MKQGLLHGNLLALANTCYWPIKVILTVSALVALPTSPPRQGGCSLLNGSYMDTQIIENVQIIKIKGYILMNSKTHFQLKYTIQSQAFRN